MKLKDIATALGNIDATPTPSPSSNSRNKEPLMTSPNRPSTVEIRSAAAAQAAAQWEALEAAIAALQHDLHTANAANAVLSQTNTALQNEIASLRFDSERLIRENTAIQERINIAAETLLAIRSNLSHRTEHNVESAVAAALLVEEPRERSEQQPRPATPKEIDDAIKS